MHLGPLHSVPHGHTASQLVLGPEAQFSLPPAEGAGDEAHLDPHAGVQCGEGLPCSGVGI